MPRKILQVVLMFALAATLPLRADLAWLAVTAEERAATASTIQPDAGAEILYRLKQIDDSEYQSPFTDDYMRIKVYNQAGVESLAKVDIPYDQNTESIKSIAARIIKPDGRIIDVERKAFYDREVVKSGDLRLHVRSFSFPTLEPGSIVEYKWTTTADTNIFARRLDFASDMPTRHVVFMIKPLPIPDYSTNAYFNQCGDIKPSRDTDGFSTYEMRNVPPVADEPDMPPENDTRPWMAFYPLKHTGSGDFWANYATDISDPLEKRLRKTSKDIRDTAAQITHAATTDEQRLALLCDYCRANILNFDYILPQGGLDPKLRAKQNRSPDEIIKTKLASKTDMQAVFIALARAAGFNARAAFCADRSVGLFRRKLYYAGFLPDPLVAVKLGDAWRYYDPAHCLVQSGKLRWQNAQSAVLILQPRGIEWAVTPAPAPEDSLVKRTGTFRLNEEGTLLGDVRIDYTGIAETDAREDFYQQTEQKIEKIIRNRLQSRLPNAEVSDVSAINADDPLKPFSLTYSVKIPGYAENTGQRLFLQPAFFEKGLGAMFTAATRASNISFHYPINQKDDVTIAIPPWMKIEEGSAPESLGETDWGKFLVKLSFRKSDTTLLYSRELVFSMTDISAKGYTPLKNIFDKIHLSDAHTLTLHAGAANNSFETKN